MPGEGQLPVGPQRELTTAIHDLYLGAGKPGTRKISNAIRERDDLPDTVSHEAVRAILVGSRSRWHKVESVVRQLAAWSVEKPDVRVTVERIHKLWLAATDVDVAEPYVQPADPALFRQAVRGLHGVTHADAIAGFLRMTVYVPQTDHGAFLAAATATDGLWICAFTNIGRLRAHPHGAGDWIEITGKDLVRRVSKLRVSAGILIDPAAAPGQDVSETLPLPHDLVAELATNV